MDRRRFPFPWSFLGVLRMAAIRLSSALRRAGGGWEANPPEPTRIAGFENLSIPGAAGRSQIQVPNEYEIGCYTDPRCPGFAPALQAVVAPLGGRFEIYWTGNEFLHRASPAALAVLPAGMSPRSTP